MGVNELAGACMEEGQGGEGGDAEGAGLVIRVAEREE